MDTLPEGTDSLETFNQSPGTTVAPEVRNTTILSLLSNLHNAPLPNTALSVKYVASTQSSLSAPENSLAMNKLIERPASSNRATVALLVVNGAEASLRPLEPCSVTVATLAWYVVAGSRPSSLSHAESAGVLATHK